MRDRIRANFSSGGSCASRRNFEECHPIAALNLSQVGEPSRHPLDEVPLPHRLGIDVTQQREQCGALVNETLCVSGEEWTVVLPHRHAEVLGWLGPHALRIDELEQISAGPECVPT